MNEFTLYPVYQPSFLMSAFKIGSLYQLESTEWLIAPRTVGLVPTTVTNEWVQTHQPVVNGYLVIYEDGRKSYFPRETFEGCVWNPVEFIEALKGVRIEQLALSNRVVGYLTRGGFATLGDILKYNKSGLLAIDGISIRTITLLEGELKRLGLELPKHSHYETVPEAVVDEPAVVHGKKRGNRPYVLDVVDSFASLRFQ